MANIVFFNYRFLLFLHGSTWLVHTSCLVPLFPIVFLQWKTKSSHESLQPSSKIKSWPIRHLNNYFPPGSYFPLSLISESPRLNSLSQNGPRKGHDSNFNKTVFSMLQSRCCAFFWMSTSSLALIGNIGVCFFCNSSFSIVCQRVCLWPFYLRHGKQKISLMLLIDCLSESRKSQIKDTQH